MYNGLLENVNKAIKQITAPTPTDREREFMALFADPVEYHAIQERKLKREQLQHNLTVAAVSLAVVGEIYHIARPALQRLINSKK